MFQSSLNYHLQKMSQTPYQLLQKICYALQRRVWDEPPTTYKYTTYAISELIATKGRISNYIINLYQMKLYTHVLT